MSEAILKDDWLSQVELAFEKLKTSSIGEREEWCEIIREDHGTDAEQELRERLAAHDESMRLKTAELVQPYLRRRDRPQPKRDILTVSSPGGVETKLEPEPEIMVAAAPLTEVVAAEAPSTQPQPVALVPVPPPLMPGVIDPSNQLGTANRFLVVRCSHDGSRTLHHWQGKFWLWRGSHYKLIDDGTLRTGLYRFLAQAEVEVKGRGSSGGFGRVQPNKNMVNNLADALEAEAFLEPEVEMPGWLGTTPPVENPKELVSMQNGLLDMRTRKVLPHSPEFWSANVVEFDYDPEARAPRFEQFLEEIWPGDVEAQQSLLEMFGLCLTDETRCHKAFMFVGPPRGGRGTIGRVLRGLIGEENYIGATFADFGDRFGLESWIGKKVAVFSDATLDGVYKREQGKIAERLKQISGDDKVSVQQKNTRNWNGVLRARMIVFANDLLRFQDDSGALAGRFITWRMKQSFDDLRADRGLTEKLLAERSGIFNLALDALDRLRARGWQFSQPTSGREMGEDLKDLASPIRVFVKDRCEIETESFVLLEKLFFAWRSWAQSHGVWAGSCEEFSKKIRAAFVGIASGRPRTVGDKPNTGRKTVLYGIGLRSVNLE